MNELILYTTKDGRSQIKLRADQQTVWLTQLDMAELFDATKQNISLHLKNVFQDGELDPSAVVKESLTTAADGKRYRTQLYNLDAILAVGYRVRSPRGVQFRRWASTALKEYLLKGFVMDDERLKNPDGRPDYFDEMLARIRDIRASEERFYQKVRNLFADGEMDPAATVKESLTVQTEGARQVQRKVTLYNLDAILAVGYRVRSPRGVQFRRWASTVLKEYLLKGFALDDERLKNPDGRPDYFDEMLARIRDIRASEKRFYQKVRDLFALASDYDKTELVGAAPSGTTLYNHATTATRFTALPAWLG